MAPRLGGAETHLVEDSVRRRLSEVRILSKTFPGGRMTGGDFRARKCRVLNVVKKLAPAEIAAARIATSFAWARLTHERSTDEGADGTTSTAASKISRNAGSAAGILAMRFRSDSSTASREVRQSTNVSSESWSRIWLAPVVEAAPAMSMSASQKMRSSGGASDPASGTLRRAATLGAATTIRDQQVFELEAERASNPLDLRG
jgi:hypothetical protein